MNAPTDEKLKRLLDIVATRLDPSSDPKQFFIDCIGTIAGFYDVQYAFIGLLDEEDSSRINTYVLWNDGYIMDNFSYDLAGTPCQDVLSLKHEIIHEGASQRYPGDDMLVKMGIDAYFGAPLIAMDGSMLGLVSVMDRKPFYPDPWMVSVLNTAATRLAMELDRLKTVQKLNSLNQELLYRTQFDPVTEAWSRKALEEKLYELQEQIKPDIEHALLYIDLDQFKVVNDTAGHTAGDELLAEVAILIQNNIRDYDMLARVSGDEFAVILEKVSTDEAFSIAQHVLDALHQYYYYWGDLSFQIGASIGLAMLTFESREDDILAHADVACHHAKEHGRDQVQVYSDEEDEVSMRKAQMNWVPRIQSAIDNDEFVLYSQIITPLCDQCEWKQLREILLRLPNGEEMSLPDEFIPAAERYGIMTTVDRYVVKKTFDWIEANPGKNDVVMINLSGQSLGNEKLLNDIEQRMIPLFGKGTSVCFEITETAAILNMQVTLRFMKQLKRLGAHFALDDFGSGLSSFAYLKGLPVNVVKIDGMFISDMATDSTDASMVEAINRVSKTMNLCTIAEHVPDDETIGMLKQIGVDYAQGFHLSHPEPLS